MRPVVVMHRTGDDAEFSHVADLDDIGVFGEASRNTIASGLVVRGYHSTRFARYERLDIERERETLRLAALAMAEDWAEADDLARAEAMAAFGVAVDRFEQCAQAWKAAQ